MVWVDPLDLKTILINTIAGSVEIFTMLMFIAIAILAAMFRMNNFAVLIMFLIGSLIIASFISNVYLILIILIAGLVTFYSISKIVK